MDGIHGIKKKEGTDENGGIEFLLSDEDMRTLFEKVPGLICRKRPGVVIHCVSLDDYMQSPYLTGATLYAKAIGEFESLDVMLGNIQTKVKAVTGIGNTPNTPDILDCVFFLRFSAEIEKQIKAIVEKNFIGISFERWKVNNEYDSRINEVTDLNDRLVLTRYRQLRKPILFGKVDLKRIQQKLEDSAVIFQENIIPSVKERCFILSHNGIICYKELMPPFNPTYFFQGIPESRKRLLSIIMLKDKYRPMINLSRNYIEQLNLETVCALSILDEIVPEGVLYTNINRITIKKYSYISMKSYLELFTEYPEWEEMLRFNSEAGKITAEELKRIIDEKGICVLNFFQISSTRDLYSELCFAFLKSNYTLYLKYGKATDPNWEVFTVVKKKNGDESDDAVFPPSFCFELSEDSSNYDMVKNCIKVNGFCNREHRLIKFLEKNSKVLEDKVPGLWNKILSVLTQEYRTNLVRDINLILNDLRKITDLEISIPDRLFLSDADVI